jgi:hypothetical protein
MSDDFNAAPIPPGLTEEELANADKPLINLSRGKLWLITVLLIGFALYLMFGYLRNGQSEVATKGVKTDGQVIMKDLATTSDGVVKHKVYFTFQDAEKKNHQGESYVDEATYEGLKPNAYVDVYYLPEDMTKAILKGGEGTAAPYSEAVSFLAWSLLIVGLIFGVFAWRAPKSSPDRPKGRGKGPIVTRR